MQVISSPSLKTFPVTNPLLFCSPTGNPFLRKIQTVSPLKEEQRTQFALLNVRSSPTKSTIFARRNRKRNDYQRSNRRIWDCISFIASNLNLLQPDPLHLLPDGNGTGAGKGGGVGFWKGSGWGGFGWKRRKKFGFLVLLVSVSAGLVWGNPSMERDLGFRVWISSLLGFSFKVLKRGIDGWILGFCCVGLVFWFLRRNEFRSRVEGFRSHFVGDLEMFWGRRRGRGRRFLTPERRR